MARLALSVFDVFSPVRLTTTVNGRLSLGYWPAGTEITFVFDARIRLLVPRITLAPTRLLVTLQDPDGIAVHCQEAAVHESGYTFTYATQTLAASALGPYQATVYVYRLHDALYEADIRYLTEPFTAFVLEE